MVGADRNSSNAQYTVSVMQNGRFEFQQLMLWARTRSGWVSDRPALSDAQLGEIRAIVGERVPGRLARDFRFYLNQIYSQAVEDSLLLHNMRVELAEVLDVRGPLPKLATLIQRQIAGFQRKAAQGRAAGIRDTECLRRILIAHASLTSELANSANVEQRIDERVLEGWYTMPRLLVIFDDLNLAATRGREWFIPRQVVRALAALMQNLTGSLPGRTYRARDRSPDDFGERGWFHELCNQVAGYAYDAVPAEARPKRKPSCQRIAREELKALEAEWRAQGSPKPVFLSQFPSAH